MPETPYQLRVSHKARNVYLRMSVGGGLQVVVPWGYDLKNIPAIIEKKRTWIERIRRRFAEYQAKAPTEPMEILPWEIHLTALNEIWSVTYRPSESKSVRLKENPSTRSLQISGNVSSELACRRALRSWLSRRGVETLVPWLKAVSVEIQLPFADAAVRLQRTRWGSCSRRKNINLNAKLLFLRPELVRYLFIHELSHLVHMNHSPRYWNFVAAKHPDYEPLDREMRTAMRLVPRWV